MLIESTSYGKDESPRWEGAVLRYCEFDGLNQEGGEIDATFLSCAFRNCDWYWGIFNLGVFVSTKFENCTFRGTAFAGCKFIECEFSNCKFLADNLNGSCSFDDTLWYGCKQGDCIGLEALVPSNSLFDTDAQVRRST
jgi:uncharacterized protein YjbI with pentapeptide repeats